MADTYTWELKVAGTVVDHTHASRSTPPLSLVSWSVQQDAPAELVLREAGTGPSLAPFQAVELLRVVTTPRGIVTKTTVFKGWICPGRKHSRRLGQESTTYTARCLRWRAETFFPKNAGGMPILGWAAVTLDSALGGLLAAIAGELALRGMPTAGRNLPTEQMLQGAQWEGNLAKALDAILATARVPSWHWWVDPVGDPAAVPPVPPAFVFYSSRAADSPVHTIAGAQDYDWDESIEGRNYKTIGLVPFWSAKFDGVLTQLIPAWSGALESTWRIQNWAPYTNLNTVPRDESYVYRLWSIPVAIAADPDSPFEVVVQERSADTERYSVEIAGIDWANHLVVTKEPLIVRSISPGNKGKALIDSAGGAQCVYAAWLRYSATSFAPDHLLTATGGSAYELFGVDAEEIVRLSEHNQDELDRLHEVRRDVTDSGSLTVPGQPDPLWTLGSRITAAADGLPSRPVPLTGWKYDFEADKTSVTFATDKGQ